MEQAIQSFPKQFEWEPEIENEKNLQRTGKYVLCGMGGSHLQGDIMQSAYPGFDLSIHQDYGLPDWPEEILKETLVICSSYSGNTEETLEAFHQAIERGYPVAVSATGGTLLELAKERGVPYVQLPNMGIQPRAALGFTFKALAKLVGKDEALEEARQLTRKLDGETARAEGRLLADALKGSTPVIYASTRNYAVAYNWKIKFNETGKIPAFYNVFPELNHNEMNGFSQGKNGALENKFHFIFITDTQDHPRIQVRMNVLQEQLKKRGFSLHVSDLSGDSQLHKIFSSLLVADWASYYTALQYGNEPEAVPMIEEFKRLIG